MGSDQKVLNDFTSLHFTSELPKQASEVTHPRFHTKNQRSDDLAGS